MDIEAAVESATERARERWVPPFLQSILPETFVVHVDAHMPCMKLAQALATQGLTLRFCEGKLVLTDRPAEFM